MPITGLDPACLEAEERATAAGLPLMLVAAVALIDIDGRVLLARRPEARYRFTGASLGKLVDLQRRIAEQAVPLLRPNGHLLYSTCSIEQQENQDQVSWFSSRFGFETVDTQATIPGGTELDYHDGGFFALMRRPKKS